jgi:glycosyltransferase involved in cell wall biosynthesis
MLVGIDASRAFGAAPTGTETYSRELISALPRAGSEVKFRLYTRDGSAPPLSALGPCEVRYIPFPRLWTHLRLSAEMIRHSPDALFVPSHVLPIVHPQHSLVTIHDLGYLRFPEAHRALDRWYLDLSTRWNVHAAQFVIADSEATRQDLIHFYRAEGRKIRVIHPALPSTFAQHTRGPLDIEGVKHRYGIAGDYIISVGTIHPRKNYVRLIRAFRSLPGENQLVIVGKKGWFFGKIMSAAEDPNLGARVKFLDYVAAPHLPALYAGARLLVFPSLYEGFGFPILEAQACGTPVVCSNTSSLPEVAADAAEFFDPLDEQGMARKMELVMEDQTRRKELVNAGYANLNRFEWESAARQILALISSA